jgi:hypothetical protein
MAQQDPSPESPNTSDEIGSWIFSLAPVGVAFIFYVAFIMQADLENKHLFLAYGAAAGFIGLETFWILKGWQKKRANIVLMGLVGIALTLGVLNLYLSFVK